MSAPARSRAARPAARPAPAERGRARHLRPAPDLHRRRRRVRLALAAGVLVSAASLFLIVASNVLIAQGQFELAELAGQQDVEQQRYERLRLEVAERSSPEKVVSAAVALGMVVPDQIDYVSAPAAAPTGETDRTASTLDESWEDVKASLAAEP